MTGTLEVILRHKRIEVASLKEQTPLIDLVARMESAESTRDFAAALKSHERDHVACIAEIKRASPSRGLLVRDFTPETIAREYAAGGAAAISVLTDEKFFHGRPSYVAAVREKVPIPVLRKDFIVDEYQLYESRILGSDAILLIVAALKESELRRFVAIARDLDLAALVECHAKAEIDRAVACGASIVGVNNRDLQTFEVSLETSLNLKRFIPNNLVAVSESGIHSTHHVRILTEAGYDAILVGEHLMTQANRVEALHELLSSSA